MFFKKYLDNKKIELLKYNAKLLIGIKFKIFLC